MMEISLLRLFSGSDDSLFEERELTRTHQGYDLSNLCSQIAGGFGICVCHVESVSWV